MDMEESRKVSMTVMHKSDRAGQTRESSHFGHELFFGYITGVETC